MLPLLVKGGLAGIMNTSTFKDAWSAFGCSTDAQTDAQRFVRDHSYRDFPLLTPIGVTRKGLENTFRKSGCCGKETCDIAVPMCTTRCANFGPTGMIVGNFHVSGTPRLSEGDSALQDVEVEYGVTPWVTFWKNEDVYIRHFQNYNYQIPGANAHDWPDFDTLEGNALHASSADFVKMFVRGILMDYDTHPTLSLSFLRTSGFYNENGTPFHMFRRNLYPPLTSPLFAKVHNKTFDEVMQIDPPPEVLVYDQTYFVKYNDAPCRVGRWDQDFYIFQEVDNGERLYEYYAWEAKYLIPVLGENPVKIYPREIYQIGDRAYNLNRLVYHVVKCPDTSPSPTPPLTFTSLDAMVASLTAPGGRFEPDPSNPSSLRFALSLIPVDPDPRTRLLNVFSVPSDLSKLAFISYAFNVQTGVGTINDESGRHLVTTNKADLPLIYKSQLFIASSGSMNVDDILDAGKGVVIMIPSIAGNPRAYMAFVDTRNESNIKLSAVVYNFGIHLTKPPSSQWIKDADFTQQLQYATQAYASNPTAETAAVLVQPPSFPAISGAFSNAMLPAWITLAHGATNPDAVQEWTNYFSERGNNGLALYENVYASLDAMRNAFMNVPNPESISGVTSDLS